MVSVGVVVDVTTSKLQEQIVAIVIESGILMFHSFRCQFDCPPITLTWFSRFLPQPTFRISAVLMADCSRANMATTYVSSALGSVFVLGPRSQFSKDVRHHLFSTEPVTKVRRVRPLWMSEELRHVAAKRTTEDTAGQPFPTFEDACISHRGDRCLSHGSSTQRAVLVQLTGTVQLDRLPACLIGKNTLYVG